MPPPPLVPPDIGSSPWDLELASIGVERAAVDQQLRLALGSGEVEEVDPHAVDLAGDPAEVAAGWVLLHQRRPSYAALMYLRFTWFHADTSVRDWIVRQFAAMLTHGPGPVAESCEYALWVDYFETPSDAPAVFTSLTAQLPHTHWHRLLSAAGPVPWAAKRTRFAQAAQIPALHAALARGIAGSFYNVYGNVDAVEAAQLLKRITVADNDIRAALTEATTQPLRLRSGSVIVIEDPAWEHPGSILVDAQVTSGRRRFVSGSELVADGVVRGRLMHWSFPFNRTLAHRVIPGSRLDGHHGLHRVEGAAHQAQVLVDRELQMWPPGLRGHVERDLDAPDP